MGPSSSFRRLSDSSKCVRSEFSSVIVSAVPQASQTSCPKTLTCTERRQVLVVSCNRSYVFIAFLELVCRYSQYRHERAALTSVFQDFLFKLAEFGVGDILV